MNKAASIAALIVATLGSVLCFAATDEQLGKPQFGQWGFDLSGADFSIKPGDDFFRYANGTWLEKTQIPADKPAFSLRLMMTDVIAQRLHFLMETLAAKGDMVPTSLEGKVGAFYRSFMDETGIEQAGVKAIAGELESVKHAKTHAELAALMGRTSVDFESSVFSYLINVDLKDPTRYAFYIGQSGLELPDRDYYLLPSFATEKAALESYVATLLQLVDWPDPRARAKDVVGFETQLAQVSWTKTQQRDALANYNAMSVDELKKLAPGFDWTAFIASARIANLQRVVVQEKTAFPKLAEVYAKASPETIRAWQAFHIADNAAPYLSRAFQDAYFQLHNKALAGQLEQRARWKRAITAVSGDDFAVGDRFGTFGTMGFGVGQLYSARYFPPSTKAAIEALVANVKAAYRLRIEKLAWMGADTKREALKKLDTYTIKVGYPEHPRDYSKLTVHSDDLVGNVRRAAEADWTFLIARFFGPVDRSAWIMTPQTNDAYNGDLRDIVFPAGILQPPIFDVNADAAINYGGAGAIIGHELTHGFDDQGRKVDAAGALRNWWTQKDARNFEKRAAALGAQFSQFHPVPGATVNGELTMGENIADLGGLTLALDAYRASLMGATAPQLSGFSGDQRVFLGWAQAWRGKVSEAYVRKQVVGDPHSPRQFRVIGPTRNIDGWYDAFKIQANDEMYLAPENRVRIW
jgi:putative endopeptidase